LVWHIIQIAALKANHLLEMALLQVTAIGVHGCLSVSDIDILYINIKMFIQKLSITFSVINHFGLVL